MLLESRGPHHAVSGTNAIVSHRALGFWGALGKNDALWYRSAGTVTAQLDQTYVFPVVLFCKIPGEISRDQGAWIQPGLFQDPRILHRDYTRSRKIRFGGIKVNRPKCCPIQAAIVREALLDLQGMFVIV